jgi:hypothetical protein
MLVTQYHQPLKKLHEGPSVVVLDTDHTSIINRDAERAIAHTHNEKGTDFPWQASMVGNCCAAGTGLLMCNIL